MTIVTEKIDDDIIPWPYEDKSKTPWKTEKRLEYIDQIRAEIYGPTKKLELSVSKIESYVGKILEDYKSAVFRGTEMNYSDQRIFFFDYSEPDKTKKVKSVYLSASVSQMKEIRIEDSNDIKIVPDPGYTYWLDILDEVFFPLKDFIVQRKKDYYGE